MVLEFASACPSPSFGGGVVRLVGAIVSHLAHQTVPSTGQISGAERLQVDVCQLDMMINRSCDIAAFPSSAEVTPPMRLTPLYVIFPNSNNLSEVE